VATGGSGRTRGEYEVAQSQRPLSAQAKGFIACDFRQRRHAPLAPGTYLHPPGLPEGGRHLRLDACLGGSSRYLMEPFEDELSVGLAGIGRRSAAVGCGQHPPRNHPPFPHAGALDMKTHGAVILLFAPARLIK
jgi:hypothetical protein